ELLLHLLAHDLLVVRLQARAVVLRPWRGGSSGLLALGRTLAVAALSLAAVLALGSGSLRLCAARRGRGLVGRLLAVRRLAGIFWLIVCRHGFLFSRICSPERLATRTLRPSARTWNPTRVGLPSLGSSSARLERWIGASLEMIP